MGNDSSKSDNSNYKSTPDLPLLNKAFPSTLTASYLNLNDNLSYKGLKTETSSSDISDKTTERTLEQEDINDTNLCPFDFEWKEGGKRVLLTGSFVNWSQYFEMAHENKRFHFLLTLPKQQHQFKFIVDNEWKCSQHYEIKDDGNYNLNNYIDLTLTNTNNNNNAKDTKNRSKSQQPIPIQNNEYNCYNPDLNEMNVDAPLIPYYYKKIFKLNRNTNQDKLGKKRFVNSNNIIKSNNVNENNCYKKIYNTPHVNVNHILIGVCGSHKGNCVIKSGIAVKFRQKVVTVIYYTPS